MSMAVIGGCGFVGLNIVEALLHRGVEVHVLDVIDPPSRASDGFSRLPAPWSATRLDIRDGSVLAESLSDPSLTAVIHAAAITADSERERSGTRSIVDVNLGGLAQLLDTLSPREDVALIYVGSSAVFGALPNSAAPIGEDWPQRPTSLYGITKSCAERMVIRWSALHHHSAAISRLGWVFGPWERPTGLRDTMSPILQVTNAARDGESVVLARDATVDWLYARDAGEAIARLAIHPRPGAAVYNIGPMQRWPISSWCRRLEAVYPQFRWTIGPATGTPIALYHDADGAPLDSTSFQRTFGPLDWHDADRAFEDYIHGFINPF